MAAPHGRRRRLSINITPAERAGRAILGLGAVIAGTVLLASAGSVLAVVLEALLVRPAWTWQSPAPSVTARSTASSAMCRSR